MFIKTSGIFLYTFSKNYPKLQTKQKCLIKNNKAFLCVYLEIISQSKIPNVCFENVVHLYMAHIAL